MVKFLYTNIGRGHPFYLDGIVELLKQDGRIKFESHDVFEISKDPALTAWRMARWLYKIGSTDSVVGKWYNALRSKTDHNLNSFAMRVMGADLRKNFLQDDTPLVVDHPVLVGMLNGKKNLLYQHGEIAVPEQAVVRGADFIFVPLEESAIPFLIAGYRKDQVIVTGLCIEPKLVEQSKQLIENRIKRLAGDGQLTGAFFSSGAEPGPHIEKIVEAITALSKTGGKAIVFAGKNGRLHRKISGIAANAKGIEIQPFETRAELEDLTNLHFDSFDYLVAPSHERTNWAVGLGLPMLILEPPIGPFSPINREFLLRSKTAVLMDYRTAEEFPWAMDYCRTNGDLANMALAGWGKYPISGFRTIAYFLTNKYATKSWNILNCKL